jgi:WD40 repeat protein/transcriptional regulator with XRE-family HTH domain
MHLEQFRTKLREYLRRSGYSQKQLAYKMGLHVTQLSNKLNGHNNARLTKTEIKQLVKILAEWGAITSQRQALELLALLDLNINSFSSLEWEQPPLSLLESEDNSKVPGLMTEIRKISQPPNGSISLNSPKPDQPILLPAQLPEVPALLADPTLTFFPDLPLRMPPRPEGWKNTIQTGPIYNRKKELEQFKRWILEENCRVVGILGLGGVGKTTLTLKLVEQLKGSFDFVIWHSLYNAPPLESLLNDIFQFFADPIPLKSFTGIDAKLRRLLKYLQNWRGLLVLDNWETILEESRQAGYYRSGYEDYRQLLEQIGQTDHQSCLLLTSREKPLELGLLETKVRSVHSMTLRGLEVEDAQQILQDLGLVASTENQHTLIKRYSGNPLALKLVAAPVQTLYGGKLEAFLQEEWSVFGGIEELLAQQLGRLSELEQQIIYWLALSREAMSLQELSRDLSLTCSHKELAEALLSLNRRNLLEKEQDPPRFSLQPVILEYLTNRLVEQAAEELNNGTLQLVQSHALLKAEAKEYVQASQQRLIVQPIVARLQKKWGSKPGVVRHLEQLINKVRAQPLELQGYSGGNLLNLLSFLKGNLNDYDFSGLRIWQANLQGISLERVNFEGADLGRSSFTQAFDSVASVVFSPNGDLVAAGCYNGEIRVWEARSGQQVLECKGHSSTAWSVAFSPDGTLLASGSTDHTIKLWSVASGACLKTLQGHSNLVYSVVFSPDGTLLASGGIDQSLKLWSVASGECLKTLQDHTGVVTSVAFSPNGYFLASGSDDHTIKLWEVMSGKCLKTLTGHSGLVRSVAFSPDDAILASGSTDCTIKLWAVASGNCLKTLQEHSNLIMAVAFSPDGRMLASGSADQNIKLWEVVSGTCLKTLQGHTNMIYSVAFSPDSKILVSGSGDQSIKLWEAASGECLKTLQGYINLVWSVAFSPDGATLASGSADHTIKLWDMSQGVYRRSLHGHKLEVRSVAFSPDRTILASGGLDQSVKLWDVSSGQCLRTLQGHKGWVWSVAFSPDGTILASSSGDYTIKLWAVDSGQCLKTLEGHNDLIQSVAFSPDGKFLVSGSADRSIKLWEVDSGQCLKTLIGHTNWVWSVAFSPDGSTLASAGLDSDIRLWNVAKSECLRILQGHSKMIYSVVFSPDGQVLASGSADQSIRLWDVTSGECLKNLAGHTNWIWSVAFSPNGRMLASGSADQSIKLWEVASGECLSTLQAIKPYEGMKITGVTGITEAQKANLKALGAIGIL